MRYNLAQLLKEPSGSTRKYKVDEDISGIDPELKPTKRLTGQVVFTRTVDGVLATGHLSTAMEIQCNRCLEPFVSEVGFDLEEELHPTIDLNTGTYLPQRPGEEETAIDAHHVADLTEVVRQNVFLALPMHPTCSPDCAGLCTRCGANLNKGPCGCEKDRVDRRLAALKELVKEDRHATTTKEKNIETKKG